MVEMYGQVNKISANGDLDEYSLIKAWLGRKSENTRKVYRIIFFNFYDWLQTEGDSRLQGLDPDQLIHFQRKLNKDFRNDVILKSERNLILDEALRYIGRKGEDWRTRYKRKVLSTIRSFFTYHLGDEGGFPKLNNGEARSILKGKRRVEKDLTIEQLKTIIDRSNAMYRTVFKCMLASGMGIGEVVQWSDQGIDVLKAALERPYRGAHGDLIEIRLEARLKSNIEADYHVYIGGSALEELKRWLKRREKIEARFNDEKRKRKRARQRVKDKEGRPRYSHPETLPSAIFVNNVFKPLSVAGAQSYWMDQVKRHRLVERGEGEGYGKRYGVNLHQIRSIFRTRWAKVPARAAEAHRDMGEYFMGHTIDPLDYNRIHGDREYRIETYSKAIPFLDLENPDYGAKDEELIAQGARIRELEEENERLNARVAEIETVIMSITGGGEGSRPVMHDYSSERLKQIKRTIKRRRGEGQGTVVKL